MKNILVEYKGGGYSGCFWEWNYFLFDNDGDFFNLFSSGYKGIGTKEKAIEMLNQNDRKDGITIVDLNDRNEIMEFINAGNAANMVALAKSLFEYTQINTLPDYDFVGNCYECDNELSVIDMFAGDYSGDGDISYSGKNLYCENCH